MIFIASFIMAVLVLRVTDLVLREWRKNIWRQECGLRKKPVHREVVKRLVA